MTKLFIELLILFKWLVATNNAKEFRDDVEDIKSSPSGSWTKRFGRVQPDKGSGDDTDGNNTVLPTGNTDTSRRERKE